MELGTDRGRPSDPDTPGTGASGPTWAESSSSILWTSIELCDGDKQYEHFHEGSSISLKGQKQVLDHIALLHGQSKDGVQAFLACISAFRFCVDCSISAYPKKTLMLTSPCKTQGLATQRNPLQRVQGRLGDVLVGKADKTAVLATEYTHLSISLVIGARRRLTPMTCPKKLKISRSIASLTLSWRPPTNTLELAGFDGRGAGRGRKPPEVSGCVRPDARSDA